MWVWSRSWEDPLKEGRETFPVFLILLISLAILFVFCLFNKIIVSYITKCVVEPSKKWWLGYLKQLTRYIEKAMAPHFSTLAWKIPWMEEPGRLQSVESLRVGHNWATSLFTFMHWRRKWQPTPVFLPGESQGWWSLMGCHLWGRTESDTTEAT